MENPPPLDDPVAAEFPFVMKPSNPPDGLLQLKISSVREGLCLVQELIQKKPYFHDFSVVNCLVTIVRAFPVLGLKIKTSALLSPSTMRMKSLQP